MMLINVNVPLKMANASTIKKTDVYSIAYGCPDIWILENNFTVLVETHKNINATCF